LKRRVSRKRPALNASPRTASIDRVTGRQDRGLTDVQNPSGSLRLAQATRLPEYSSSNNNMRGARIKTSRPVMMIEGLFALVSGCGTSPRRGRAAHRDPSLAGGGWVGTAQPQSQRRYYGAKIVSHQAGNCPQKKPGAATGLSNPK